MLVGWVRAKWEMFKGLTQEEEALVFRQWCSRHMTSDKSLFQELDGNGSGNVTFGDNSKRVI